MTVLEQRAAAAQRSRRHRVLGDLAEVVGVEPARS
jgi:hypothetical protein